jgi:hypothetical protein
MAAVLNYLSAQKNIDVLVQCSLVIYEVAGPTEVSRAATIAVTVFPSTSSI